MVVPFAIITSVKYFGRLAQLARAPRLHRGGYRFESYIAHTQNLAGGYRIVAIIRPCQG